MWRGPGTFPLVGRVLPLYPSLEGNETRSPTLGIFPLPPMPPYMGATVFEDKVFYAFPFKLLEYEIKRHHNIRA